MLDFAFDVRPSSRLSCQIKVTDALDGLVVPRAREAVLRSRSAALLDRRDAGKIFSAEDSREIAADGGSCACKCYLALLLCAGGSAPAYGSRPAVAQQQRWAAIDPNSEGSSPVVWGATEDEARQRAVEACKRLSKTCANGPAVHRRHEGGVRRHVLRAAARRAAPPRPRPIGAMPPRTSQEMFADAGYTNCSVRHYMSGRHRQEAVSQSWGQTPCADDCNPL